MSLPACLPPQPHTLPDGGRVLLRPITSADRTRFVQALPHLSPRSRHQRFHTPNFSFSAYHLSYLTEVDQHHHVALGVVDLDQPDEPGIAVGRYICLPDQPGHAELALTVVDAHQHRGIGSLLMRALLHHAAAHPLTTFDCHIQAERTGLIDVLCQHYGATVHTVRSGIAELALPVPAA